MIAIDALLLSEKVVCLFFYGFKGTDRSIKGIK